MRRYEQGRRFQPAPGESGVIRGRSSLPWVACFHQGVQCVCVCVSDVVADLCLGSNHVGVTRVVVFGAKAAHREVVQLEVEKAAGEWRTGVSDPKTAVF